MRKISNIAYTSMPSLDRVDFFLYFIFQAATDLEPDRFE